MSYNSNNLCKNITISENSVRNLECACNQRKIKAVDTVYKLASEDVLKPCVACSCNAACIEYLIKGKKLKKNCVELSPRILICSKINCAAVNELLELPCPILLRAETPVDNPVKLILPCRNAVLVCRICCVNKSRCIS